MTDATETTTIEAKPEIKSGMVIRVHEKIEDTNAKGEKRERIQIFEGLVLGIRGSQESKTFTIRKVTNGYGVEKIFALSSPNINKLEIVKQLRVRRAKLTFVKDFGRKLKEIVKRKK